MCAILLYAMAGETSQAFKSQPDQSISITYCTPKAILVKSLRLNTIHL